MFFFSIVSSKLWSIHSHGDAGYCGDVDGCVTYTGNNRLIFGSGTRIIVQTSKSLIFFRLNPGLYRKKSEIKKSSVDMNIGPIYPQKYQT